MPTDETTTQPSPVRWRILGVTLAVGFMALLDVTIVNVAIPSMQAGLRYDHVDHPVGGVRVRPRVRSDAGRGRPPG